MPEYLSPGVYVEEVPAGVEPIPGVPTGAADCWVDPGALERPQFFNGRLLTAEDLETEQRYWREKSRRLNRHLHGWGVVWGLSIAPEPSADQPWRVRVDAGLALAPDGDEVIVPQGVCIDLAKHRPGSSSAVFVGVRYAQYPTRPIAPPTGSATDAPAASRIQDSVVIGLLGALPPSHRVIREEPSLCDSAQRGRPIPCPPSVGPWVVLAKVRLPPSPRVPIRAADLDAGIVRRVVGSTTALQAAVVECCCRGEHGPSRPSLIRWLRILFRGR